MVSQDEYMQPTAAEKSSRNLAYLIRYVLKSRQESIPQFVESTANNIYGDIAMIERLTRWLCIVCTEMPHSQKIILMYDKNNSDAQRLAEWWENHQKDEKHLLDELESDRMKALEESTKGRLSREEIDVFLDNSC